ncbi:cellulose biosynthesis protein BcsE [Candidatus Nitrotoga arctica]|uniref:cellulose biosynthesis protein BcsE n=1 Tax=Candidatus Nitrotoga arctica TaxID=453162 RepID=UPI001EFB2E65|nr:cellulose biosynthesis protein BcsE [Candidatus Nitrotoga arctica]
MSLILRLLRKDSTLREATINQTHLGVLGLPADVGLCGASLVSVLLVRDEALGQCCALSSARNFKQAGQLAILASGESGQKFMDQFALSLDTSDKGSPGVLVFFRVTDDCAEIIGRLGANRFFDEIGACGVTAQHTLLVQEGQAIFDWQNHDLLIKQWQAWKAWAANHHAPILLIIKDIDGAQGFLPLLRALPELVPNLAVLDADCGGGLLTVERWAGQDKSEHRQFGLKLSAHDKSLNLDGSEMDARGQVVFYAPDQGRVIATAATVAGVKGVPAEWTVVSDLSDMEAVCDNAVAATILLHADGDQEFETLSRFVHRMRSSHPRSLKIVVRETTNKLRYNNELMLLRLGVNLMAYKEIPFSRVVQVINDMSDQIFSRPVENEYLLAVQAAEPNRIAGYLSPSTFCREVAAMLKRSERIDLGHSLVRLPILSRVAQLDALQACQARRLGDIFTADQNSIYLFLFACRESDVDSTLDRLFSVPVTELFSSHIIEPTPELIWESVGQLRRDNENSPMSDYSAVLQVDLPILEDKVERLIAITGLQKEGVQISPSSSAEITQLKLICPVDKHRTMRPFSLPRHATTGMLSNLSEQIL